MRRLLGFLGFLLALHAPAAGHSQTCEPWPASRADMPGAWFDPHPSAADVSLTLGSGIDLVFRSILIDTTSLYGDSTFRMGSAEKQVFEAPVDVRISSPISSDDGRRILLFGKYEVTKAQYVYVMGRGDPAKGLALLAEKTGETRVAAARQSAGTCTGVTPALRQMLAEPVTYLTYSDYVAFVEEANSACIALPVCAEKLRGFSANREVIAFLRLPLEHEWEYAARRGGALTEGLIDRAVMQADLPDFGDGLTLTDVAHLDRDPDRVVPVGSRRAVDGIHDLFGNAAELMQNAFTSEIGYGAVGGYVARGGHYRLSAPEIRVSMRSELLPFRVDDDTGQIVSQRFQHVGLRLALALPVAGSAARTGSDELASEFADEFTQLTEARDAGGGSIAEAGDLGLVTDTGLTLRDRLSDGDRADFLRVQLGLPARLNVEYEGPDGVVLELLQADGKSLALRGVDKSGIFYLSSPPLLPGPVVLRVASPDGGDDSPYRVTLTRSPTADTGIAYPTTEIAKTRTADVVMFSSLRKELSGYVGSGDASDFYQISNGTPSTDALVVTATATDPTQLTIRLLDEELRVVAEVRLPASGKTPPLPFPRQTQAFLQVEAPETAVVPYGLTLNLTSDSRQSATSQAAAAKAPPLEDGKPVEGLIGLSSREAHFRLVLTERRNVRVDLAGFSSDLDLRVRSERGEDLAKTHLREGLEPEVFIADLDAGIYFLRVAMKQSRDSTAFRLGFETSVPQIEVAKTLAEAMKSPVAVAALPSAILNARKINGVVVHRITKDRERGLGIRLSGFSARANLDMRVVDSAGNPLQQSSNPGAEAEELTVPPGQTVVLLVVEAMGAQAQDTFTLNLQTFDGPTPYLPTETGTVVSTHGDWTVVKNKDGECLAVTGWQSIVPSESRLFRFTPSMRVHYWKDKGEVFISLLTRDEKNDAVTSSLEVESGGRWRPGESSWIDHFLEPTVIANGEVQISSKSTALFTSGTRARISGTYKGTTFEIIYSLKGYSAANREANRLCGAQASWVVR